MPPAAPLGSAVGAMSSEVLVPPPASVPPPLVPPRVAKDRGGRGAGRRWGPGGPRMHAWLSEDFSAVRRI